MAIVPIVIKMLNIQELEKLREERGLEIVNNNRNHTNLQGQYAISTMEMCSLWQDHRRMCVSKRYSLYYTSRKCLLQ